MNSTALFVISTSVIFFRTSHPFSGRSSVSEPRNKFYEEIAAEFRRWGRRIETRLFAVSIFVICHASNPVIFSAIVSALARRIARHHADRINLSDEKLRFRDFFCSNRAATVESPETCLQTEQVIYLKAPARRSTSPSTKSLSRCEAPSDFPLATNEQKNADAKVKDACVPLRSFEAE